ncbi:hypothetical protein ACFSKN_07885 [Mariniflexile gromovii]|uniref:Uncharacterized protein n=1 Tax=Mariniflexile gromovii TaxID=362523 RepID=A0ABS4BQR6_9FLAO|nr:hypothetical protein [Mariniflexile gromovii]MBP0902925.1 hypothetical protein [Mariniflexile gromovii]
MNLLIESDALGQAILLMLIFMIGVPIVLFIAGLITYTKNKKRGKTILIIATIYSLISAGVCGGFMI